VRHWLREQRTALIALAVAASAAIGAYLWLDVLPSLDVERRASVEAENTAEIAGQTVTLGATQWSEFEAPAGSQTLSVRLKASGGPDAELCGPFELTEPGSSRVWLSSRAGLDVPYDDGEASCVAEDAPYRILLVFLVPDDAVGPFRLTMTGPTEIVRFEIEP
jgi:hypothetical protein